MYNTTSRLDAYLMAWTAFTIMNLYAMILMGVTSYGTSPLDNIPVLVCASSEIIVTVIIACLIYCDNQRRVD